MLEIQLEGLEFYAYHGFYAEEQKTGNRFTIDLKVKLCNYSMSESLYDTVDYEQLYKIVKHRMDMPTKLLETVAENIVADIFSKYSHMLDTVEVALSKHNPPIGAICSKAKIVITKNRNEVL
jgi:7,8-dihydroneopterin aldolase/epimerase/oxygenase